MNKKQQQQMTEGFEMLAKQKEISVEEMSGFIEEIIVRVFSKGPGFDHENEDMEAGHVDAKFDIATGTIDIKRHWEIISEADFDENKKMYQLIEGSEEAGEKKAGEILTEEIDLLEQPTAKIQQIKQLLIQRTREAEKSKLYDKFSEHDGKLIMAKVQRAEETYYILDYEQTAIFLPKQETLFDDNFREGQIIKVYISSIDKVSKDAQVVASRTHPLFVKNVIEQEVEDVQDGIIEIVEVSRMPGFKTKISVRSKTQEVDPVGAIVGIKGSKIRQIMEALGGERVDVIRHSDDIKELIAEALTPAKIVGLKYEEVETVKDGQPSMDRRAVAIVEEDQFLSALGKGGKNVKLAVRLTKVNIDVKTEAQAKEEGIEYEPVVQRFSSNKSVDYKPQDYSIDNVSLEELADLGDSVAAADDIDYDSFVGTNDVKEPRNEITSDDDFETGEDLFDDSYDEYDE